MTKKTVKKNVVPKSENNYKTGIFNEKIRKTISFTMLSLVAIIGLIFIVVGSISVFNQYKIEKDYVLTTGDLIAYNKDKKLYIPTYEYTVDNNSYFVQSDYGMPNKEIMGTKSEIYYNKENPRIAIVPNFDYTVLLLVIGLMMVTLPLALYLLDSDTQKDDKTADIKAIMVIIFGLLYYLIAGTLIGTYNPIKVSSYNWLVIIIPLFYVFVGVYSIIKIFVYRKILKNQH